MMQRRTRIAVISTMGGSPWGGSEELWAAMVDEALNENLSAAVSVYRWPSIPPKVLALQKKSALIFQRRLPRTTSSVRRLYSRVIAKSVSPFRDLFCFKPDVICISQGGTYDFVRSGDVLSSLYTASTPYIVICHSNSDTAPPEGTVRQAATEFFVRAFRVVFVSHRSIEITERQLATTLPNAIVLRNPVNLSDLTVVPWPSSGSVCMACAGDLKVMSKGQDVLFEALSSEVWRSRDWRLCLYGDGPDRSYLEALAKHYGITDCVEFRGYVKDIRAIWSENHLLVLPSRVESAPLALVEAMLCGRPSVVTDVGGITEWVEEQRTGFVAAALSTKSFRAALDRAWRAQADWENMGIRAHEAALARYDQSPGRSLLKVVLDAACSRQSR